MHLYALDDWEKKGRKRGRKNGGVQSLAVVPGASSLLSSPLSPLLPSLCSSFSSSYKNLHPLSFFSFRFIPSC